jgi:hypothetical protein
MKYTVTQRAINVGACIRKKSENVAENLELVSQYFCSFEVSEHVVFFQKKQ